MRKGHRAWVCKGATPASTLCARASGPAPALSHAALCSSALQGRCATCTPTTSSTETWWVPSFFALRAASSVPLPGHLWAAEPCSPALPPLPLLHCRPPLPSAWLPQTPSNVLLTSATKDPRRWICKVRVVPAWLPGPAGGEHAALRPWRAAEPCLRHLPLTPPAPPRTLLRRSATWASRHTLAASLSYAATTSGQVRAGGAGGLPERRRRSSGAGVRSRPLAHLQLPCCPAALLQYATCHPSCWPLGL